MKLKHKNIAVLVTGTDSDAQASMIKGIEKSGKQHGCNIAVFEWSTGAYERDKHNLGEINITYLPDLNLFDGVIIFANTLHVEGNKKRMVDLLRNVTCPVVCIGCKLEDYYCIGCDNYSAMRKLVEHYVCERKMTRLHFVKGVSGNPDGEARFRAYADVLSENNIPVIPERISQGDFYISGGESAAREILGSNLPFPEAIICANDIMALTICDILKSKGYSIPEDVEVSGYDYSIEGRNYDPPITTVRTRFLAMGEAACKTILDVLNGEDVPKEIFMQDEVVFGGRNRDENDEINVESRSDIVQRRMIHQMNDLNKSIMEGDSYEDWLEALKEYIYKINPSEFYFCANEDFIENVFECGLMDQEIMSPEEKLAYTPTIKVVLAYQNGFFKAKDSFASEYAFDDMFKDTEKGKIYHFSPLHYLERNYGYVVFVDTDFTMNNPIYINWLINMANSIENIRKHNLLKHAMERLDEMYIKDSLTGVYNRFGMERFYAEIKRKCMMSRGKMQISFVDIDGLKRINDLYGHDEGDRIINATAEALQEHAGKFYVIRYGGDEFIVMGIVQSEKEVEAYWNHAQQNIENYNNTRKKHAMLSLSFGYDIFEIDAKTYLEDCIRVTDQKMYEIKNQKKEAIADRK